ncbi:MAG: NTP transferase domain-containing protein [Lewinellaceae bacterium]|nr:NTP transferase domain-containing protein [Lewinellaceae bacterium]
MASTPKHQKHPALARPALGFFHRQEWAIIGTPCGEIQSLARALTDRLTPAYKVAYVDADHQEVNTSQPIAGQENRLLTHGATLEYTDKINYHRFDQRASLDTYQFRPLFNEQSLVLVNGNHFTANTQIVVLDPRKEESLQRKRDRLSLVDLILTTPAQSDIYPWLAENLGERAATIPRLALADHEGISKWLANHLEQAQAPLYGLVLAGGKSTRMGHDKGVIAYHGKPHREHLAELLQAYCQEVFISCRPEQAAEIAGSFSPLPDTFSGLGPFGAILSAFRAYPDVAWLVVACDLPYLDAEALQELIVARNPQEVATTFRSPFDQFPEPLVTIWEPRSYPLLLQFLAQGYSCPRKVLINAPVKILEPGRPETLQNVNTPEELRQVKSN